MEDQVTIYLEEYINLILEKKKLELQVKALKEEVKREAGEKDMTQKLKNYFLKTGLYKLPKLSNRQQRQVIQDVGCTRFQLVEYMLYGTVTESKED